MRYSMTAITVEEDIAEARRHHMARISYDEQTATAFKAVREAPRDGL